ncbi:MAG: phosphoribosylformylglycinamidine cyclo-ligase [Lentisphaerae bacterium]|nr:phosphoribosylformylglycinamidine cyclo-ligase [Lentisphaerota bacterium]
MMTEPAGTLSSISPISAYAAAGVDIDSKMSGIQSIKKMVAGTATAGSVGAIGSFGGLFSSPGKDHLLVASTDGVGTKLKVAVLAKRHDTVGQDLVNHCVNDILVQGAQPLFFMDYLGASRFDAAIFQAVVAGLCKACKANNCALLGGETAELPGLYPAGEYDLVGTIVGAVEKRKLITGAKIRPGDAIIGLPSGGLQTNGYSLARRVIFDQCGLTLNDHIPGTRETVEEGLLAVHRSFLKPVNALLGTVPIHGMAHITGGGFVDNIPRVLPDDTLAVIDRRSWTPPTLFTFIERQGKVEHDEMYRVFNMGIGYVIIVARRQAGAAMEILRQQRAAPVVIGSIEAGQRGVVFRDEG